MQGLIVNKYYYHLFDSIKTKENRNLKYIFIYYVYLYI